MTFDIIFDWLFKIFFGYVVADFMIGIFHWIKDTYFNPHTPILGGIFIWQSRLHHIKPQYITTLDDYDIMISSAKWASLWAIPLFYYVEFSLFTLSLFLTVALNDVIHKYSHLSDDDRPEWATFLQNICIFQSPEEHNIHHKYPHTTHYCPISPFVNYFLEKYNFWRKLEYFIETKFGIIPRNYENEFVENKRYPGEIKFLKKSQ